MKHTYKKLFFSTAFLLSSAPLLAQSTDACLNTTCFMPRSQSFDKARQVVGSTNHVHMYNIEMFNEDNWYGSFFLTTSYTRSFKPDKITQCLFGPDVVTCGDCQTIRIQGSHVEGTRDSRAWLADYFYLPTDYNGSISFEPRISNVIIDFDFFITMDEWLKGLYLRLFGPFVHTKWDLNFCETITAPGIRDHQTGYFAPSVIENANLLKSFGAYANGSTIDSQDSITFNPLKYSRINNCDQTKNGFADLRMELGWNYHRKDDDRSRFGVNIQAAAPTGGQKQACFLFDPMVGNGNHWELGAGVTAHHIFWLDEMENHRVGIHFEARATHLFAARQQRTFDLCGRPNSRYMLAQRLGGPVKDGLAGRSTADVGGVITAPTAQFQNEYTPVANLTTLNPKVSIAAQGEILVMFNYTNGNFSGDIGYNFWGRSCEKFSCLDECTTIQCCPSLCDSSEQDTWALKGDARTFGFVDQAAGGLALNQAVALSASQHSATIRQGNNGALTEDFPNDPIFRRNAGVDNNQFAVAGTGGNARLVHTPGMTGNTNQIRTSVDPKFLNCNDLLCVSTRGLSHKIFAHFDYAWADNKWMPTIGIGGFAEFGQNESTCCDTNTSSGCCPVNTTCNTCIDCSLSQWGVWFKGGITFK